MAKKHYTEQYEYTSKMLIPYLNEFIEFNSVIDVGCGEGGSLQAFIEHGYVAHGLELEQERAIHPNVMVGDATKQIPVADLTIMRDVIEHVYNKVRLINNVNSKFLFITFPPKWSPYAAHQQSDRFYRFIPYANLFRGFDVMETAITIREFEALIDGFSVIDKRVYLFRPIFRIRFGLPIIRIPSLEFAFGAEYLLEI